MLVTAHCQRGGTRANCTPNCHLPGYWNALILTNEQDKEHDNIDLCQNVLGNPWVSVDASKGRLQLEILYLRENPNDEPHYELFFNTVKAESVWKKQTLLKDTDPPNVGRFGYTISAYWQQRSESKI